MVHEGVQVERHSPLVRRLLLHIGLVRRVKRIIIELRIGVQVKCSSVYDGRNMRREICRTLASLDEVGVSADGAINQGSIGVLLRQR